MTRRHRKDAPHARPLVEAAPPPYRRGVSFRRELGRFDTAMVVVGGIIGAGIFINPYIVAQRLDSPALVMAAWVAGGVIALAGALGSLSRYGLSKFVNSFSGPDSVFTFGTLVVNVIGCFLFGLIVALSGSEGTFSNETKIILLAGFMGAFTTFSTFAFEGAELLQKGHHLTLVLHILAHNVAGLIAVFAGLSLGSQT